MRFARVLAPILLVWLGCTAPGLGPIAAAPDASAAMQRLYIPWVSSRWSQEPAAPSPVWTPTAAPSATPTPTFVASPTPPCTNGVTLSGLVYDALLGPTHVISGAVIAVGVCAPRSFGATTDSDGRYVLYVPGAYLLGCPQVSFQASAVGYATLSQFIGSAALCLEPERDAALALLWTPTPGATASPTWTPTATHTPITTQTDTAPPSATPTGTPRPIPSLTDTPIATPTPTHTPTEPVQPSATPTTGSGGTVYITASGAKYHTMSCRYVRTGATPVACAWATTNGYTACSVCRPYCP